MDVDEQGPDAVRGRRGAPLATPARGRPVATAGCSSCRPGSPRARLTCSRCSTTSPATSAVLLGDACLIFRLDDDGEWLRPVSWHHQDPAGQRMLERHRQRRARRRVREGMVGTVVARNRPLLIKELDPTRSGPRFHPSYLPYLEPFGIRSLIEVPLRVRGRTTGALVFARNVSSAAVRRGRPRAGRRRRPAGRARRRQRRAALPYGRRRPTDTAAPSRRSSRPRPATATLLDSSPIPVSVLVGERQQYANAAALRLFGVERPEDLVGHERHCSSSTPDDRERVARTADSVARGRCRRCGLRFRVVQPVRQRADRRRPWAR